MCAVAYATPMMKMLRIPLYIRRHVSERITISGPDRSDAPRRQTGRGSWDDTLSLSRVPHPAPRESRSRSPRVGNDASHRIRLIALFRRAGDKYAPRDLLAIAAASRSGGVAVRCAVVASRPWQSPSATQPQLGTARGAATSRRIVIVVCSLCSSRACPILTVRPSSLFSQCRAAALS
jgi:hypothetical protein